MVGTSSDLKSYFLENKSWNKDLTKTVAVGGFLSMTFNAKLATEKYPTNGNIFFGFTQSMITLQPQAAQATSTVTSVTPQETTTQIDSRKTSVTSQDKTITTPTENTLVTSQYQVTQVDEIPTSDTSQDITTHAVSKDTEIEEKPSMVTTSSRIYPLTTQRPTDRTKSKKIVIGNFAVGFIYFIVFHRNES